MGRLWNSNGRMFAPYALHLIERGAEVFEAWKQGDESGVVTSLGSAQENEAEHLPQK